MIVTLKDGVGYIDELSFTDNSSWNRSGKFRLGATVINSSYGIRIREGMTNAFKVKDHRGESYQKHHPPSLNDEVWRLEKIGKDGASHKRLTNSGISTVGDFLRMYNVNITSLRKVLDNVSERTWDIVIKHAITCTLDDTKYLFRSTAPGVVLVFNPVYKVIGVTFDDQNFRSLDYLDAQQLRLVECLKERAYKNLKDWIPLCDPYVVNNSTLLTNSSTGTATGFSADQLDMQKNPVHPTSSPPYDSEVEHDYSSYDNLACANLPEVQVLDWTSRNSVGMNDSLGGLDTWASGGNYIRSQVPADDDILINYDFLLESSPWFRNGLFPDSTNHQMISSISKIDIPSAVRPKTSWAMILAVVKWRILVKRKRAARSWRHFNNCY
ncbi:hypothetical protein F511_31848 [Dorcoceras hygrometricum]|uniref:Uncharacterized protein n=1 Tax=Dorcoceras hygrometricum TaxID=472368 RepID=A0A2Z7ACZ3_9LAMI|nr:hypothetical protein F511_31848 [Dorcoceras hygrometricum]